MIAKQNFLILPAEDKKYFNRAYSKKNTLTLSKFTFLELSDTFRKLFPKHYSKKPTKYLFSTIESQQQINLEVQDKTIILTFDFSNPSFTDDLFNLAGDKKIIRANFCDISEKEIERFVCLFNTQFCPIKCFKT